MEALVYLKNTTNTFPYINQLQEISAAFLEPYSFLILCEHRKAKSKVEYLKSLIKQGNYKKLFLRDLISIGLTKKYVFEFLLFCYIKKVAVESLKEPWLVHLFELPLDEFRQKTANNIAIANYLKMESKKLVYTPNQE